MTKFLRGRVWKRVWILEARDPFLGFKNVMERGIRKILTFEIIKLQLKFSENKAEAHEISKRLKSP